MRTDVVIVMAVVAAWEIMAALVIGAHVRSRRRRRAWPSVEGLVLSIDRHRDCRESRSPDALCGWYATYVYTVDGREHRGHAKSSAPGARRRRPWPGDVISVHYDPGDPAAATPNPSDAKASLGVLIVGTQWLPVVLVVQALLS
jgi:hypothetical protein